MTSRLALITYPACGHTVPSLSGTEQDILEESAKAAHGARCPRCRAEASAAARALRAIPSQARAETSRANGRQGGRPRLPLSSIPCTCGAGEGQPHKYNCKRRLAQYQRERRARLRNREEDSCEE